MIPLWRRPVPTLFEQIAALPWYHRIALPDGIVTPGWAPMCAQAYRLPERMDGLRVLDVGTWDGYWAFEALKRGASEVLGVDDWSDPADSRAVAHGQGVRSWETFDLCRAALGFDEARCQRRRMSLFDLRVDDVGTFDEVLFYGVLYHLRYPLLGLDTLSKVCSKTIRVESAALDDFSPYRGGVGCGYAGNQMVMEFYPGAQYGKLDTNWWSPTIQCLADMVRAAGWETVTAWKLTDKPANCGQCRGFVTGHKLQEGETRAD